MKSRFSSYIGIQNIIKLKLWINFRIKIQTPNLQLEETDVYFKGK